MKLLAADIGNTNLTLGLFEESELVGSWRGTTQAAATDDEVAVLVSGLGRPPVRRTQEARVLVTAREIVISRDGLRGWLVPHMNGRVRLRAMKSTRNSTYASGPYCPFNTSRRLLRNTTASQYRLS